MARIILNPGEAGDVGSSTNYDVFGSTSGETVFVDGDAVVAFDPSFNGGGDTLVIDGLAADYSAHVEGSNIVLTNDDGAEITIPVGSAGITLVFNGEDERELVVGAGGLTLGDQTIPTTGETDLEPGGSVTPTPTPGNGETFFLDVSRDLYINDDAGTAGDDYYDAGLAQNQNGEQANTLGSGDRIDGGAGTDTLFAQVQDASPLNSGPGSSIRPLTVDVEVAHFQANTTYNPSIFSEGFSEEILGVEINAADMDGLDEVGSVESDASLTIYNVNTLQDNGEYDDRRLTQSVRVRMDHTGNGDVITPAADLAVLFDNDYLLRDTPNPSNSSLTLQLLDIDNQINDGTPLATMPFDRLFLTVGGVDFTVDYDASNDLTGLAAYQALAAAINVGLAAAGLDTLNAAVADSFTVVDPDGSPGGPASGFNIVITDSAGAALSSDGFGATGVVPPNTDYQKEVFTTPPELTETLITVDVDLFKVGRGGDGGHLVIGGMDGDGLNIFNNESSSVIEAGVEQFILHVEGDSTQNSSLAGLFSTNNTLRVVEVADAGSATADLFIGNDQTFQGVNSFEEGFTTVLTDFSGYEEVPNAGAFLNTVNGVFIDNDRFDRNNDDSYDDSFLADLTSFRNLAFKDVLIFDSTAFDNDVTLYGHFSNEVVEKYLDLTDIDADPRADNGNANYAFGVGDDTLNLNFSQSNFAINGTATREDFSFTASMGAGDDLVQLQIGNGFSPADVRLQDTAVNVDLDVPFFLAVDNWYYNYVVNQYSLIEDEDPTNPDGVMAVYTGTGDDTVELWGSTAVTVRAGSGNDDVYTDNSGELGYIFQESNEDGTPIVQAFNEAKATWVFNTLPDVLAPGGTTTRDIDDLQTDVPFSSGDAVGNLWVQVTFEGIESQRIFIGNTDTLNGDVVTDLKINNAIKEAISTDRFLSSLLEAVDGPARTLIVKSMIDGITTIDDLSIGFGTTALSAQQLAAGLTSYTGIGDFDDRYESIYAYQDGQGVIDGNDSFNVNNNIVEGDTGEDVVVYSSNVTSTETFDINGVFTLVTEQDVVMNFTAAVADEAIPEVQTVTFSGEATDDGTASVTIYNPGGSINQTYSVDVADGDTDEEIAAALVALINADIDGLATAVDNEDGSIELTYDDAGIDYPQADGTVTPDAPVGEIQTIDFGGASTTDGLVSVSFAGVVRSVDITPGQDAAAVVTALVSAFAGSTVTAVATGDLTVLQLTDTASDFDYPNATVTIESSESSGLTFVVDTVQDGAPFGLTVTEDTDVNGAVPALGYDIFDVTDVIGGFLADGNFANNTDDNAETATIASLNLKARGVAIIDTVEVGDGVASSTANEAARIQQIVRSLDTAGAAQDSIIITVDADNIGHFYLVDNGSSAADAVVSHLGNVELGQYDDISKEYIGNWDAMTIANFTPLTTEQIVETFAVA